jgi:hypothetical protein
MPYKRYKSEASPDAAQAASLAQSLAAANQNAASLAASLSRIAAGTRRGAASTFSTSGAGGPARVRMAARDGGPTGLGVPWRGVSGCGPGG